MKLASHYNIEKPKIGFIFPLQTWLQNDWKEEVHSLVTSDMLQAFELDHKKFLSIVYDFYNKKANYTDAVWYLYNLALWRNNFINLMNETN